MSLSLAAQGHIFTPKPILNIADYAVTQIYASKVAEKYASGQFDPSLNFDSRPDLPRATNAHQGSPFCLFYPFFVCEGPAAWLLHVTFPGLIFLVGSD